MESSYECVICLETPINCIQCSKCLKLLCQLCYNKFVKTELGSKCPNCLDTSGIFIKNSFIDSKVETKEGSCPFCKKKDTIKAIRLHMETCEKNPSKESLSKEIQDVIYLTTLHPHPLRLVFRDNGWACNGMKMEGGCKSGITAFGQSYGMKRYRCFQGECDFDLCEKCLDSSKIDSSQKDISSELQLTASSAHIHPLVFTTNVETGECMGGKVLGSGCLGNSTISGGHYSCPIANCKFSLCQKCMEATKITK